MEGRHGEHIQSLSWKYNIYIHDWFLGQMYLFSLCHAYCWSSLHRSTISLSLAILFFPSTFMGKVVFGRRSVLEYFFEGSFFFSNLMCEQCNVLIVCLCSCVTRAPEPDSLRGRLVESNILILLISSRPFRKMPFWNCALLDSLSELPLHSRQTDSLSASTLNDPTFCWQTHWKVMLDLGAQFQVQHREAPHRKVCSC